VQRTVHEIIVRHCHLVASARGAAPGSAEQDAVPTTEVENGPAEHESWPV